METYRGNLLQKIVRNAKQGWGKISSLYPIYGAFGTVQQVWKNIFFFEVVCRLDMPVAPIERPIEPRTPLSIEVHRQGFDLENWPGKKDILELRGPYGLEQFRKRFERGDLCFAAYANGEPVGFIWVEFPPVTEAGYALKGNEAFTFDGWTFEKFRGKRAFSVIQQAINNYVLEHRPDVHNLVTHVATWNKASLSGDQRAGYRIIRLELTMILFGFHKKIPLKRNVPPELVMHQQPPAA